MSRTGPCSPRRRSSRSAGAPVLAPEFRLLSTATGPPLPMRGRMGESTRPWSDRAVSDPADAYAAAGVDTAQAGRAVDALVEILKTIDPGRPKSAVVGSGHYASVVALD